MQDDLLATKTRLDEAQEQLTVANAARADADSKVASLDLKCRSLEAAVADGANATANVKALTAQITKLKAYIKKQLVTIKNMEQERAAVAAPPRGFEVMACVAASEGPDPVWCLVKRWDATAAAPSAPAPSTPTASSSTSAAAGDDACRMEWQPLAKVLGWGVGLCRHANEVKARFACGCLPACAASFTVVYFVFAGP